MSSASKKVNRPGPFDGVEVAFTIIMGNKKLHLKEMDRHILEAALGLAYPGSDKPPLYVQAGEVIINSCLIGGDKEILKDEPTFIGACFKAYELIEIKEAEIVKY